MRRRNLIAGLVITTVSWPLAVHAQQPAIPVVGFLGVNSAGTQPYLAAFRQGLGEIGYDGQNVVIEYRWTEDQYNRSPELVADLIRHHVNVIVTLFTIPAALAVRRVRSR
jgi:putative ABC transport system substrate-binding protein